MTIHRHIDPAGNRDILHHALGQRSHRAHHLPALNGSPEISSPLPVYVLSRDGAEKPDPLAEVRIVGWKYLVVGGDDLGLASLVDGVNGPEFGGISHGVMPQRLLSGARLVDEQLGPKQEELQARILDIPALRICALWLVGPTNYFVSLLDGHPPGTSVLVLETDIRPRIAAALAAVRLQQRGVPSR
jgi:hypothetical protein